MNRRALTSKRFPILLSMAMTVLASSGARADTVKSSDSTAITHRLMICEYGEKNRIAEVAADGKIVWEYMPPSICVIFQPLEKGHVLVGLGGKPTGVREVDREGKTVFDYVSQCEQVMGCERMRNGNTLVAEEGPPRVVEVDPKGNVVSIIQTTTSEKAAHRQIRCIHKLENGNVLVCHEAEGAVREYDKDSKVVWEYKGLADAYEALRLPNGNTLMASGTQKRVVEVDAQGKTVWEFTEKDGPDLNLAWITSLQVLPNGHYLINNFIRGHEGKGAHAFEVDRETKKVLWTFADHDHVKTTTMTRVITD